VAGADPVAVDATCCRIMRLDPRRIGYLTMAAGEDRLREDLIPQTAESIASVATPFQLLPEMAFLRSAP